MELKLPTWVFILINFFAHEINGINLRFELPNSEKMCFTERFVEVKPFVFQYKVLDGGNKDVDVSITSPNGKPIYRHEKMHTDKVEFQSSLGEYEFCFSNEFSTFSDKIVDFSLYKDEVLNLAVETGMKKPIAKTSFESSCDNIHEYMTMVVGDQSDYRLKEFIGRKLADLLSVKVTCWSIIQTVVILISGFGQIFVLKTFFTEKSSWNQELIT